MYPKKFEVNKLYILKDNPTRIVKCVKDWNGCLFRGLIIKDSKYPNAVGKESSTLVKSSFELYEFQGRNPLKISYYKNFVFPIQLDHNNFDYEFIRHGLNKLEIRTYKKEVFETPALEKSISENIVNEFEQKLWDKTFDYVINSRSEFNRVDEAFIEEATRMASIAVRYYKEAFNIK